MVAFQLFCRALFSIGSALGQDCPLLGPAYLPLTNPDLSSTFFQSAKTAFEDGIAEAFVAGLLSNETGIFSVQVFSSDTTMPLYEYHYVAQNSSSLSGKSLNSETLYRIGSVSKVVSVYSILSRLSDTHWDDPVVDLVPELARVPRSSNVIEDVQWSEITLGELASQLSGIGRDYASSDYSTVLANVSGFPVLTSSETITCGSFTTVQPPCNRSEALTLITSRQPVAHTYHTPIYSNMAFQLLGYAIEAITGEAFSETVNKYLIEPLKLARTFYFSPGNDTNAVIVDGWTRDLGDENPAGGFYQSLGDMSQMGRSILLSSLLPSKVTRKWLKPLTHTSSLYSSVGRPWEIMRLPVASSPASNISRVVDLYTKSGNTGSYASVLILSPDHHIGISILTGNGFTAQTTLLDILVNAWIPAVELATRAQAGINFAGNYTFPASGSNTLPSSASFSIVDNQPGLFLSSFVSEGTDLISLFATELLGIPSGQQLGIWLYPMDLNYQGSVAFRSAFGLLGTAAGPDCTSWSEVDGDQYGTLPLDLFIFHVGADGKATALELPELKKTFTRET